MDAMAREGHMLCDYESSVQTSDEETVCGLTKCDGVGENIQEEDNRKVLEVRDRPSISSSSDTSHSPSRLPASYSKRTSHRYSSKERSSSRHHKKHEIDRYDHRRTHHRRTSSRRHSSRSPNRSSRHRRPSRRHRRRDTHRHDRRARKHSGHRRSHHKHRRSSSSSNSSSSRETSIKSCRSHEHKSLTQAILTVSKDVTISKSKPADSYSEKKSDSNIINQVDIPQSGPIARSNGAVYSKEVLSTNLAVQRLNAQEVLHKIQKHQEAQAQAQAKAAAAAANLPKYYNPCSVNALRLAEQQQKRKLLWSKKDNNESKSDSKTSLWASTSLIAGKGDSAAAAKFRKLMGIHDTDPSKSSGAPEAVQVANLDAHQRAEAQEELFRSLEHIYEMSRTQTHTQRGVGLGFSAASHVDYTAYSAMQNDSNDKKL